MDDPSSQDCVVPLYFSYLKFDCDLKSKACIKNKLFDENQNIFLNTVLNFPVICWEISNFLFIRKFEKMPPDEAIEKIYPLDGCV
jgi:hypothetical protein